MELDKAVKKIVDQFGKEVLADKRFINMIADYYSFRDNPADKRILSVIVNDGFSAGLLKLEGESDFSITINRIVTDITNNYGFKEELIEKNIKILLECIGDEVNKEKIQVVKKSSSLRLSLDNYELSDEKVFYLKSGPSNYFSYDAKGHYNFDKGSFVILKGSSLSAAKTFGTYGLSSNEYHRMETIKSHCHYTHRNYIVDRDICCDSPNEAAFTVTGNTIIGLIFWEDSEGNSIYQDKRYKKIESFNMPKRLF